MPLERIKCPKCGYVYGIDYRDAPEFERCPNCHKFSRLEEFERVENKSA